MVSLRCRCIGSDFRVLSVADSQITAETRHVPDHHGHRDDRIYELGLLSQRAGNAHADGQHDSAIPPHLRSLAFERQRPKSLPEVQTV